MRTFKTYLIEGPLTSGEMSPRKDYRERLVKMIEKGQQIKLQAGGEIILKWANDEVKKVLTDPFRAKGEISKVGIEVKNKLYQFKGSDNKYYKLSHIMKSGQFSQAAGFKDPGDPSGADWENLITKAFNESDGGIDTKTGFKENQWNYQDRSGDFPVQDAAKALAVLFQALGKGTMVQFGAGSKGEKPEKPSERVSKFWKDMVKEVGATASSIPKTDMLIGTAVKISLKKSGGSQTGSPTKGEAYATFQAACELVGEKEKGQLSKLLGYIKKDWTTIHSDIDARKVSSAVRKDVKSAGKSKRAITRAQKGKGKEAQALPNQDDVTQILAQSAKHKDMSPIFSDFFKNNTKFKEYFVYEAASGYKKFNNGEATANKMVEFNPYNKTLTENINIGSNGNPSGDLNTYANEIKFDVGFKSAGGGISSSIRLIKAEYEKPEPTFQDIVEDSIQEMDFSDFYSLNEQRFLDEAAWFKAVKDKISNVWNTIWDKTIKILDRIIALGKRAFKALMKFFGVEVDTVTASGPTLIFAKMV